METTTQKRQKFRVKQKVTPSPDRLSSLPDLVLCHILSFLPTKLSVATSILARRWRFLWTHVPNLNFEMEGYDGEFGCNEYGTEVTFSDIINRVMVLHNTRSINTLRILYRGGCDDDISMYQFDAWIRNSITRNVRAFEFDFVGRPRLPPCLFNCKTLVDLRLIRCSGIPVSGPVCLPSLKKLHLHEVKFRFDEAFPYLISGCPVLEELTIKHLHPSNSDCCKISSPTVKWLSLEFELKDDEFLDSDHTLEIDTPSVRRLILKDGAFECISAGRLNSLVEADIVLNNDLTISHDFHHCRSVVKFVDRLCQMKCLRLSSRIRFEESAFTYAATARFHNLTKLELSVDWGFLMKFLESADNLEVLIIRDREDDWDLKWWAEPGEVPMCLSSHLKQVTIGQFGCLEPEFDMLSYLLRNSEVLNLMEIHAKHAGASSESKLKALQRISQFERGSKTCKLTFF